MMYIPTVEGTIDRRLLVNYRVPPATLQRFLPAPFRPKLIHGMGLAGICLIRLKDERPRLVPAPLGLTSENAAHRIAVEWDENGERREGVYIPRRDTASRFNTLIGGRLFPGIHHHAHFEVSEGDDAFSVRMMSDDGETNVAVKARLAPSLPESSIFRSLEEASAFFEQAPLGYSVSDHPGRLDTLELRCAGWNVEPLQVLEAHSSFFEDRARFPEGSATLDCALLMRGIRHEWHLREPFTLSEGEDPAKQASLTAGSV